VRSFETCLTVIVGAPSRRVVSDDQTHCLGDRILPVAHVAIDHRKCEGKKDCLRVCPTQVFRLGPTEPSLPWYLKLKVAAHGGKQAFVVNEPACTACMECVKVCPEHAITVTA
jgi:4Fe-4S ferredoxin